MSMYQWRAEVWRCLGRLLDWMAPYQVLVLSSAYGGHCYCICAVCDVTT